MKKSNKRYFLLIFLIIFFVLPLDFIDSAEALVVTVTPSDTGFDTDATPSYCFGGVGSMDADDYIVIKFPSEFDLSGFLISDTETESELEVHIGTGNCDATGVNKRVFEDATADDETDRDPAELDGNDLYMYFNDVYWDSVGFSTISFYFVDKTDAGNTQAVKNPSTADNYPLIFAQGVQGTGPKEEWTYDQNAHIVQLIYIGGLNDINISANVEPVLTLSIVEKDSDTPTTSCALGTFDDENINTCVYRTKIVTNASAGYTTYLVSDGDLRTPGGDVLAAEGGDDSISEGAEEYGLAVSSASSGFVQIDDVTTPAGSDYADCDYINDNDVSSASFADISDTNDLAIGSSVVATDGDYITLCHGASITPTTKAGSYSQVITITLVGNF